MLRYLTLLALVFAACGPSGDADTRAADQSAMELFLLAGQSNMAGRGDVETQDRLPDPRVLMFTQEGEWKPAVDPVHFDKPIAGVGPGRSFGLAVAEKTPGVVVGLIPTAVGGSPISTWRPGARDDATNTHPYDDAMRRLAQARQRGELKAVLWHQGESDSQEALAPLYKERLAELIARFRDQTGNPNLPFLIGQMGRFPEKPWTEAWTEVDRAQRELAAEIPGVAFVPSDGLTHKGDTLHFDTASAREMGRRYAEAYFKLIERP
ncbi:MAG: sialate O-acetylesterase [Rhodothermales bacterium]